MSSQMNGSQNKFLKQIELAANCVAIEKFIHFVESRFLERGTDKLIFD